jgi:hypothetical protein
MHFNLVTGPYLKLVIHTACLVLRENNTQISSKVFPFQFVTKLHNVKKSSCVSLVKAAEICCKITM